MKASTAESMLLNRASDELGHHVEITALFVAKLLDLRQHHGRQSNLKEPANQSDLSGRRSRWH
jgi:hypothetical protein